MTHEPDGASALQDPHDPSACPDERCGGHGVLFEEGRDCDFMTCQECGRLFDVEKTDRRDDSDRRDDRDGGLPLARMLVSTDLLFAAMGFPRDATLLSVRPGDSLGQIELLVHAPSFPRWEHGLIIPLTSPVISEEKRDCGHVEMTWNWGLPQESDSLSRVVNEIPREEASKKFVLALGGDHPTIVERETGRQVAIMADSSGEGLSREIQDACEMLGMSGPEELEGAYWMVGDPEGRTNER